MPRGVGLNGMYHGIHPRHRGNNGWQAQRQLCIQHGHFVHVFVERAEDKSVPIPLNIRSALEKILVSG